MKLNNFNQIELQLLFESVYQCICSDLLDDFTKEHELTLDEVEHISISVRHKLHLMIEQIDNEQSN